MPRRTNPFQQLVYLIKTHVGGDATVEESAMLADLVTGQLREVDVCIRDSVAGHEVIVSIECSAKGRPEGTKWVQEMHAKHERLPTNSLILAAKSGFTNGAYETAKTYGISLAVPGELSDDDAGQMIGRLKSLWYRKLEMRVVRVRAWVDAIGDVPEEVTDTSPDTAIYTEDHNIVGSLEGFTQSIVWSGNPAVLQNVTADMEGDFDLGVERVQLQIEDGSAVDLYVEFLDPQPQLRRIRRLIIGGHAKVIATEFPLRHGELTGTPFGVGEALVDGNPAILVVTMNGSERKVTVKVKGDRV